MFAHDLCSFLFITEIFSKRSEVFDYRKAIHVAMIVARCESLSGDTSRIAFAGDQAYNKPHDFQRPLVINLFLDDRLRPSTDRSKFENQTKESSRYLSDITTGTLAPFFYVVTINPNLLVYFVSPQNRTSCFIVNLQTLHCI